MILLKEKVDHIKTQVDHIKSKKDRIKSRTDHIKSKVGHINTEGILNGFAPHTGRHDITQRLVIG